MARGVDGFGVVLEREATAGAGDYAAVANITSLSGPTLEREEIEVTAHDSPDQYEEFVFGIKRTGELSADVNYDPAKHDLLLDDWSSSEPRAYRVTWPDAASTRWQFDAGLTGLEPEAPHDDKLEASLTFKISGVPNFDA